MSVVPSIRHLFALDDGSLPDVYIEGLTPVQIADVYRGIRAHSEVRGDPTVWSNVAQASVPLRELGDAAESYLNSEISPFRHALKGFVVSGVEIPDLTVALEADHISFDYRMGAHWDDQSIEAFMVFLAGIKRAYPTARIFRADEGAYSHPNQEFQEAMDALACTVA